MEDISLREQPMPFTSDEIFPNRIYLDTGVFQAIADCGGYVFGEDPFPEIEDYWPSAAHKF